jgi:hypothetical protein
MLRGVGSGVFVVPGVGLQGGDNKVSETKQKKGVLNKVTAVLLSLWLLVLPMAVSANYVTLADYGYGYSNGGYLALVDGAGTSVTCRFPLCYWSLDDYDPNYTYTFTFSYITSESSVPNKNIMTVARKSAYAVGDRLQASEVNEKLLTTITSEPSGSNYKITYKVVVNFPLAGISYAPIWIYATSGYQGTSNITYTTNAWGASCEYDPEGDQYIQQILDAIAENTQKSEEFYTNALTVLDEIKAAQQQTNEKLDQMPDKIGAKLEEHDTAVKEEASTEGDDKINQATEALKNALPVSSIKDAITPLMTACNYQGTTSVWSFPAITIPAIPGLFDEMRLSEQQNFDLSTYADEYIPETLLQLVRYLMTAGLILFAIKELMSIISQIFGGSGSGGDGG